MYLVSTDRIFSGQFERVAIEMTKVGDFAMAVLRSTIETLDDLIEVVPELERLLPKIRPGQAVRVFPAR